MHRSGIVSDGRKDSSCKGSTGKRVGNGSCMSFFLVGECCLKRTEIDKFKVYTRRGGALVVFGAFGVEGRWFEPISCHVGTLGKSFIRSCLYGDMVPWVAALRINSTPVILYLKIFCDVKSYPSIHCSMGSAPVVVQCLPTSSLGEFLGF